ncbi:MAG: CRTAC1 family protein [Acidobacteriota bacterium]|nr:CRTAC1 family protein [Acidobacteriota bacterium]
MRLLSAFALALLATPGPVADFHNVAAAAGLTASFPNGGKLSKQFILETTGSGAAFLDYDNDGLPDIFLVSGDGGSNRLYHNEGNGKFSDVTAAAGLTSTGWGQGVCAGDFDNDGFTDLFVTYWGQNRLYRNLNGKRFEDVTSRAGLLQNRARYNSGCAFLDYDLDGHLDLAVANYLQFDPATTPKPGANPYCFYRGIAVSCGPRGLPFDRNILYRNLGDGRFSDVSEKSGIAAPLGHYSLGVLAGDFNGDGKPDIYIAADQTPSLLYINQGDGVFREEGVARGAAFDEDGRAMSGMGVASADYQHTGWPGIFRTNFSDERETLYRNAGNGEFEDVSVSSGVGLNSRFVGWGCGFLDFDNDGWPDLLLVNGHVFPEVDRLNTDLRNGQRAILYRNLRNGRFEDVSERAGPALLEPHVARGAAFADIRNDGRIAVVVNNQNASPSLFEMAKPSPNHWITVKLTGTRSNRSAIGAAVKLTAGGQAQTAEVRSGGSYLSQSDLRLHFGLGASPQVDTLEVHWPAGGSTILHNLKAGRVLSITE